MYILFILIFFAIVSIICLFAIRSYEKHYVKTNKRKFTKKKYYRWCNRFIKKCQRKCKRCKYNCIRNFIPTKCELCIEQHQAIINEKKSLIDKEK